MLVFFYGKMYNNMVRIKIRGNCYGKDMGKNQRVFEKRF